MAFADHLGIDGRLLWWGIEVSFDDFSTISYRWGTAAGDVEGQFFEERLVSIGAINRGFGNDHLPVASACSVVVDNTDFGADWLVNRTTVASQVFAARFRLKIGLAAAGTPTILTQKIGTFVCLDLPRRKDGAIQLSLADDSLAALADVLVPPTFKEWFDSAPGTTNSVFPSNSGNVELLCDWNLPTPLQFGRPFYTGIPLATFANDRTPADYDTAGGFTAAHRKYIYPILVLATRDTVAVTTTDVVQLLGVFRSDVLTDARQLAKDGPLNIPETTTYGARIWKAYKTDTITKDGYDWKLLWVAFDVLEYMKWLDGSRIVTPGSAGQAITEVPSSPEYPPAQFFALAQGGTPGFAACRTHFAAFDHFVISGAPGSGITGKSDLSDVGNPINILQDFVEFYSSLGASAVDTARFARADLVTNIITAGAIRFDVGRASDGDQQLSAKISPYGVGTLRKAISELAGTADFDVFMTMEGQVAVVVQGADFETQTTTYTALDEMQTNNVEDRIPSAGERWSPYNRIFLQSSNGQAGPYDDEAAIAAWGRVLPRVLPTKWWWDFNYPQPVASRVDDVWNTRNLEAKVRPVISFTTDVSALALELGDYFTMSWTRGGENAVYADVLWRLEAVTINPETGAVDVTAVWMDDLQSENPFLLDNEALFLRVAGSGGRTCTVTDGSDVVTFSSGSLITDGVADTDILLIRDSSEAATTFFRNRQLQLERVLTATTAQLSAGTDLDFGTAGAHVVAAADWSIVRGHSTYPTVVSDPANYPSGSEMYGKISNSTGLFNDATQANQLKDG